MTRLTKTLRYRIGLIVAALVFAGGSFAVLTTALLMTFVPYYFVSAADGKFEPGLLFSLPDVTNQSDVIEITTDDLALLEELGLEDPLIDVDAWWMNPSIMLIGIGMGTVLIATVAAWFLGFLLSSRIVRSLEHLKLVAHGLSKRNIEAKTSTPIKPAPANEAKLHEIEELGMALDEAFETVEQMRKEQHLFATSAAHELRRPISASRTLIEVAVKHPEAYDSAELLEKLHENNLRASRLLQALLRLNSINIEVLQKDKINLQEIVETVITTADTEPKKVAINVEAVGNTIVVGDPALTRAVIDNLLANALQYNTANGWVLVRLCEQKDDVLFEISNSGKFVTAENTAKLTQPLFRVRDSFNKEGYGLGLSLVESVVKAHDGKLYISNQESGGLNIKILWPKK